MSCCTGATSVQDAACKFPGLDTAVVSVLHFHTPGYVSSSDAPGAATGGMLVFCFDQFVLVRPLEYLVVV